MTCVVSIVLTTTLFHVNTRAGSLLLMWKKWHLPIKSGMVSAQKWVHLGECNLKFEYYGMWHIKWKSYVNATQISNKFFNSNYIIEIIGIFYLPASSIKSTSVKLQNHMNHQLQTPINPKVINPQINPFTGRPIYIQTAYKKFLRQIRQIFLCYKIS